MIATIWGSRGSLATPGAATLAYGGNTSCVELRLDDGSTIVLDAGTWIRELGLRLANRPRAPINLLLTHLHLDHVAGLPFFAPLWDNRAELHIWAPFARAHLAEAIARYMSPPLFPVSISEVPAWGFGHVPRPSRADLEARLRISLRPACQARRPNRRVPHRGCRPVARIPPRPRALLA
jgi:phosphoribosyl 1,2-cyclic phosphodiesterase